jgi:hypothetical protein
MRTPSRNSDRRQDLHSRWDLSAASRMDATVRGGEHITRSDRLGGRAPGPQVLTNMQRATVLGDSGPRLQSLASAGSSSTRPGADPRSVAYVSTSASDGLRMPRWVCDPGAGELLGVVAAQDARDAG